MNSLKTLQITDDFSPSSDLGTVVIEKDLEAPKREDLRLPNLAAWRRKTAQTRKASFSSERGDWQLLAETVEIVTSASYASSYGIGSIDAEEDVAMIASQAFDWPAVDWLAHYVRIESPEGTMWGESVDTVTDVGIGFMPADVQSFCEQQGLSSYLPVAVNLVEKHFTSPRNISAHLERDPETGDQWVVIGFSIEGDVISVYKDNRNYTREWVSSVPSPKRDKIRIEPNILGP